MTDPAHAAINVSVLDLEPVQAAFTQASKVIAEQAVENNRLRQQLAQAVAALAEEEAEVERLRGLVAAADEYGDRHVIDMRADGFVIAHPLSCRAIGLFACPFNAAATALDGPPEIGKFAVTLDDACDLVLGERITGKERHSV